MLGVVIVAATIFVTVRWVAAPTLALLATGIGQATDALAALLLMPEYLLTATLRRTANRAAPFAHLYGDAVCASACALGRVLGVVVEAIRHAVEQTGLKEAAIFAIVAAVVVRAF